MLMGFSACVWCRYLQNHIDDMFAGAWEPSQVTPLPPHLPIASLSQGLAFVMVHSLLACRHV